jgi:putative MATE family efflux protein
MMCVLDMLFNYVFIFGLNMGTKGAAIGTLVAYIITMVLMMYYLTMKDERLRFALDAAASGAWSLMTFLPKKETLKSVLRIGSPIGLERGVMCGAQIAITRIIAPLGSVAIAANTFGINIESLCYMPGYGISEATTTMVGQSAGAGRKDLMRSFAWISMALGMSIMALMGLLMAVFAPEMMSIVTNDRNVIDLGAEVLRIEAWAEPMFAASIVAYGAFVGSGNTLIPSVLNLGSIWIVRLTLATILAPTMGLRGVWIAMCIELCWRGLVFIIRLMGRSWTKESVSEVKEELKG